MVELCLVSVAKHARKQCTGGRWLRVCLSVVSQATPQSKGKGGYCVQRVVPEECNV